MDEVHNISGGSEQNHLKEKYPKARRRNGYLRRPPYNYFKERKVKSREKEKVYPTSTDFQRTFSERKEGLLQLTVI